MLSGDLSHGSSWVDEIYVKQDVPEQGHYETVVTGYKCSCGATK